MDSGIVPLNGWRFVVTQSPFILFHVGPDGLMREQPPQRILNFVNPSGKILESFFLTRRAYGATVFMRSVN